MSKPEITTAPATRTRSNVQEPPVEEEPEATRAVKSRKVSKPEITTAPATRTRSNVQVEEEPLGVQPKEGRTKEPEKETGRTKNRNTRATAKGNVPDEVPQLKRSTRSRNNKKEENGQSSSDSDETGSRSKPEAKVVRLAENSCKEVEPQEVAEPPRTRRSTRSNPTTKVAEGRQEPVKLKKNEETTTRRGRNAKPVKDSEEAAQPARLTRGQKRATVESTEAKPPARKKTRVDQKSVNEVVETRQTAQSVRRSTRSKK